MQLHSYKNKSPRNFMNILSAHKHSAIYLLTLLGIFPPYSMFSMTKLKISNVAVDNYRRMFYSRTTPIIRDYQKNSRVLHEQLTRLRASHNQINAIIQALERRLRQIDTWINMFGDTSLLTPLIRNHQENSCELLSRASSNLKGNHNAMQALEKRLHQIDAWLKVLDHTPLSKKKIKRYYKRLQDYTETKNQIQSHQLR